MKTNTLKSVAQLVGLAILCCLGSRAQQPPQPQTATRLDQGTAARAVGRATEVPPTGQSALTIACQCPVELLVTDPRGRRTGDDPIAHKSYDEDDMSYYESAGISDDETGAEESDPAKTLFIANTLPGAYRLSIVGTGAGTYTCQFGTTDLSEVGSQTALGTISILDGEIHKFVFQFDGQPGSRFRLWGGFTEGEKSAVEGRSFLSYATPLASSVHTTSHEFPVFIFYGPDVVPSTFSAELNAQSITSLFHPKAGGWEFVKIHLPEQHNAVQFAVSGSLSGKQTNTIDRFEITVE